MPAPDWLTVTERQMRQFALLKADWDSYGAQPVTPLSREVARGLLRILARLEPANLAPYVIAPASSGGIYLEWRGPDGHLEIEVGPDGDLGCLRIWHGRYTEEDVISIERAVDQVMEVCSGGT